MKLPSNYRLAATVGILLGAFALSALAAGTWTPPTAPPPGGNPDAPVNVGTTAQNKLGPLGVKGLVTTDFTLATGTPAVGKVLTALDSLGNATWAVPTGGTDIPVLERVYSYHAYTTFSNGVSGTITIPTLPNGDVMMAASLKYVGSSQLPTTNGYTEIDSFGDQNAYVELIDTTHVKVHLLNNNMTPYTGTSNTAEVYLSIYAR